MPPEVKNDPRRGFVRRQLPWLLGALMLIVFLATINPWVSVFNIGTVTRVSGWLWVPDLSTPLYHLVTLPFQILPAKIVPITLNLFSVVCAAMTLVLLARSVALLPHDRTEAQMVRERNDFGLLTIRSAWLPSVLAVLLCGLQLTFWEFATNGGSEMFDLLLFAFVIWSLLEYRLDEKEARLYLTAVVVGAGMAEGPSLVGYFPVYLAAIIWSRGFGFFNLRFLNRMLLLGLAGFSLFLLFPVLASVSKSSPWAFWQALKFSLQPQYYVVKLYFLTMANAQQYFEDLLMPLFIALMPLLVLSIRLKIGDSSRLGSGLANFAFHTIHAIFFGLCLWLVFDPPFSPREKNLGLTLYYIIALSAGYYAGYFLLVFGKKHPRAPEFPPFLLRLFNFAVIAAVWLLAACAVAGLVYKNTPIVQATNNRSLGQYASLLVENLPKAGAIVLSDDPDRLNLAQAALVRENRAGNYALINTAFLPYPKYHYFLHRKWPDQWPMFFSVTQTNNINGLSLIGMLTVLSKTNTLCYLHPSFGYYFEQFYQEPHGLTYELKLLPNDTLLPPAPGKDLIAENQAFWSAVQTGGMAEVEKTQTASLGTADTFADRELARLHVPQEPNFNAAIIGTLCSRNLDFWGVELQRAGDLTNAAGAFEAALQFNTNNLVAQINLAFNQSLRAGQAPVMDLSQTTPDHLGKFGTIGQAITEDGPFDVPSFCFSYGYTLAQDNGFFRQAVAPFERVRELIPDFIPARIWLARIYTLNRLPDRALALLQVPSDYSGDRTEINVLEAAAYFQKNDLPHGTRILGTVAADNPTNDALLVTVEHVYISHGMFSNALALAEHRLSYTPDDPNWLLTKGFIYNQQKKYKEAVTLLAPMLETQTNNLDVLYQLAQAYLGNGDLNEAKIDYAKLQETYTNSFQVAYGLGKIASQNKDADEAVRNFKIYLSTAPTNTDQYRDVAQQLRQWEQGTAAK